MFAELLKDDTSGYILYNVYAIKFLELIGLNPIDDTKQFSFGGIYPLADFKYNGGPLIKSLKIGLISHISKTDIMEFTPRLMLENDILRLNVQYQSEEELQGDILKKMIGRYLEKINSKAYSFTPLNKHRDYLQVLRDFDTGTLDSILSIIGTDDARDTEKEFLKRGFSLSMFNIKDKYKKNHYISKCIENYEYTIK
ncbi:MAG: hypothetical protein ACP5NV_00600 [Candidatus Woesearchaeota archaeon]